MLMTLNSSGHSIQKILFLARIQNNFGHNTLSVESPTDTQPQEKNLNFVKIGHRIVTINKEESSRK